MAKYKERKQCREIGRLGDFIWDIALIFKYAKKFIFQKWDTEWLNISFTKPNFYSLPLLRLILRVLSGKSISFLSHVTCIVFVLPIYIIPATLAWITLEIMYYVEVSSSNRSEQRIKFYSRAHLDKWFLSHDNCNPPNIWQIPTQRKANQISYCN